jgi:hypothetical protein
MNGRQPERTGDEERKGIEEATSDWHYLAHLRRAMVKAGSERGETKEKRESFHS